jgi:hypothetical protein
MPWQQQLEGQQQEDQEHANKCQSRVQDSIKLNGNKIKEVNDFLYLGSRMLNTGDGEVEIQARFANALPHP